MGNTSYLYILKAHLLIELFLGIPDLIIPYFKSVNVILKCIIAKFNQSNV